MADRLTNQSTSSRKRKNIESAPILEEEKNVVLEQKHQSSFDAHIQKQLDEINSKLSAAEMILEFNQRLEAINSMNNTLSPTNDVIIKKNNFLSTLFRSNSGNSSMRLIFFIWAIGTWIIWAGMSLYKNDLQPISFELAAILSALGAAKMGQTFGENKFSRNSNSNSEE